MRKKGYYILISLLLFLYSQCMFASVNKQASSNQSLKVSKQSKSELSGGSENSGTTLQFKIDNDLPILDAIDVDSDYEFSLSFLKKYSIIRSMYNKHAQGVFMQQYSNSFGKYQFPYLYITSSPRFIALRAIII